MFEIKQQLKYCGKYISYCWYQLFWYLLKKINKLGWQKSVRESRVYVAVRGKIIVSIKWSKEIEMKTDERGNGATVTSYA